MNIFDKIYNCWKYAQRRRLASYYMVLTFITMIVIAIVVALCVSPIVLACTAQSGWWLLLFFVTIPLVVGIICTFNDWIWVY